MRRRPIVGTTFRTTGNGTIDPFAGGKAGSKDPRNFVSGNVPGQQWDIAQQVADRAQLNNNPPPRSMRAGTDGLGGDQAAAVVRNIPSRISFVRWTGTQTLAGTPLLLVPRNPRRMAIQMSSITFTIPASLQDVIAFSWGNPGFVQPVPPFPPGNLLAPGTLLLLTGDAVPIDDLYVWNPSAAGVQFCAFEGVISPEANQ